MRHLSPEDQIGDLATMHDPKPFPVPVASPPAAPLPGVVLPPPKDAAKPPKWHREGPPTDAREAHKWLQKIEEGHAPGEVFYHPGRGLNVTKGADGSIAPVSPEPADEEAWFAAGCVGPAPLLKDRPPAKPEKATLATKTAPKKGD